MRSIPLGGLLQLAPTQPANLAGLPLWLAAWDVNLLLNAGISNNDPIGTWKNKGFGGSTYDVTQAVGGLKPLFKSLYINTGPALLFDASDDVLMGTASPVAAAAARHIFAVVVVPATFAGTRTYYGPRLTVAGGYSLQVANSDPTIESNFQDTANRIAAAPATGALAILEISFDGTPTNNPTCVLNGVTQIVTNTAGTGVGGEGGAAGLIIGNAFGEGIGEILSYNAVQTAPDVVTTRTYLSNTWGIAV